MVSARRLRIDSMLVPGLRTPAESATEPSVVGSETEVRIFRLMRPADSTTGWNSRPMPYSSFSMS